jgi:hypothetical protein
MEQTAVKWYAEQMQLKEQFTQEEFDNITNQAKEMEKEQSDNLAICFSEWCLSELLNGNEPKAETMQGLLEIFKNK